MKNISDKLLNRDYSLKKLKEIPHWDIIIIGGGATGLGAALDASSRGYKTLLLERGDFAHGTSSRSTKLSHGGVRYLAQGNLGLVNVALKERGLMLKNAPHLVQIRPFVIPSYHWWDKYYYGLGLKIYDWMARNSRIGRTQLISKKEIRKIFHNLQPDHTNGGVLYYDGQFDDARLAVSIAQTCSEQSGVLLNYFEVIDLIKENAKVKGVRAIDLEHQKEYYLTSKVVINATGVFADSLLRLNRKDAKPMIKVSQGAHLVLGKKFLPGEKALVIPKTSDGRVLFVVPWKDHLLVGTTDTLLSRPVKEPRARNEEINFMLNTLQDYLVVKPTIEDVLSVFAGLRPLVVQQDKAKGTKEISRDHKLIIDPSHLITIIGGKWTTYRKMAQDTIDEAIKVGKLPTIKCITEELKLHGFLKFSQDSTDQLNIYGTDAIKIRELAKENRAYQKTIHPDFPHTIAEILWFIRWEMARTIEDILGRRLRVLFLNAMAAMEMAPKIADLLAKELDKDKAWKRSELNKFNKIARNYLPFSTKAPQASQVKTRF